MRRGVGVRVGSIVRHHHHHLLYHLHHIYHLHDHHHHIHHSHHLHQSPCSRIVHQDHIRHRDCKMRKKSHRVYLYLCISASNSSPTPAIVQSPHLNLASSPPQPKQVNSHTASNPSHRIPSHPFCTPPSVCAPKPRSQSTNKTNQAKPENQTGGEVGAAGAGSCSYFIPLPRSLLKRKKRRKDSTNPRHRLPPPTTPPILPAFAMCVLCCVCSCASSSIIDHEIMISSKRQTGNGKKEQKNDLEYTSR